MNMKTLKQNIAAVDNSDDPLVTLSMPKFDLSTLKAQLDVQPESGGDIWSPSTGDVIAGRYSYTFVDTQFGNNRLIELTDEAGTTKIWSTAWLENCLKNIKAQTGDVIAIQYTGKTVKKGREMKTYKAMQINPLAWLDQPTD